MRILAAILLIELIAMLLDKFQERKAVQGDSETVQSDSLNSDSIKRMDKQDTYLKVKQRLDGIYEDNAVVLLAERCKKGDVSAMRQMAYFFHKRCTSTLIELLDGYESDPNIDTETAIRNYLKGNHDESKNAKCYMTWIIRAALYGDAEISTKLEEWTFYKQFAYITYDMMMGKKNAYASFWDSSNLREIGFIDVPAGYEECTLKYNAVERYFDLCYVSFYNPPDEYGFGAEWEYSNFYFSEFFCRLPERPKQSNN